jgi:hypothetical protein
MTTFNPQTDIEQLRRQLLEHKHTGLDSAKLDSPIQKQGSLTTANNAAINDVNRDAIIANIRVRVNEIEQALINAGILSE